MKQPVRWVVVFGLMMLALGLADWPAENAATRTPLERVDSLAAEIRCPTCAGLSVAQSDAPLAVSAKEQIRSRVGEGQSDEQIRSYFVSRYGATALMSPPKSGINAVPWLLPALLGMLAVGGVVYTVRRWRSELLVAEPTNADRLLVERALRERV